MSEPRVSDEYVAHVIASYPPGDRTISLDVMEDLRDCRAALATALRGVVALRETLSRGECDCTVETMNLCGRCKVLAATAGLVREQEGE